MNLSELKAVAKKQGHKVVRIPDYQCTCYASYPNKNHKHKNGSWKCVDCFEPIKFKRIGEHYPKTRCRRKKDDKRL